MRLGSSSRRLRRALVVPAALVVVSALTGAGCVPDPPVITSVTYRGALANSAAPDIRRDGAASARVGSKVVWAFGDTFTVGTSGFWSSTATLANPTTPLAMSEPTTTIDGHAAPASRLVPLTSGEVTWEAAVPGSHFLYWPSSVIPDPGNNSAVVYSNHLYKEPDGDLVQQGLNISELDEGGDTTADNLGDILGPAGKQFVHSIFLDTTTQTVYLYDCSGAVPDFFTGAPGLCKVGKVARASMRTPSAYRFWDGSAWVTSASAAVPTVPGTGSGFDIQWNPYLEAYTNITIDGALAPDPNGTITVPGHSGTYSVDWIALRMRTAFNPNAPAEDWSTPVTICGTANASPPAGCTWDLEDTIEHLPYAARIQEPLSSSTRQTIAISYYQPMPTSTDWFAGEVRVYDVALG